MGLRLERVRLDLVRGGRFKRLRYLADVLTLEGERVQAPRACYEPVRALTSVGAPP